MEEVWKTITSPVFLVCTVAATMLLSLVMHYLLKFLDKFFGKWSASRAKRLQDKSDKFERDLAMLCEHPHLVEFFVAEENRLKWACALEFFGAFVLASAACALLLLTKLADGFSVFSVWIVGFGAIVSSATLRRAWDSGQAAYYRGQVVRIAFEFNLHQIERARGAEEVASHSVV